jgi:hypothetical protein
VRSCRKRAQPRHQTRTLGRLLSFVAEPGQRGFAQANLIALPASSLGNDFAHQLRLAGVLKFFAGRLESFTHYGDRFGAKHSRLKERIGMPRSLPSGGSTTGLSVTSA